MPDDRGMNRAELAHFLRRRRETLQPGDVGLAAGARRRTQGLRREEVAALSGMSTDYYSRLEQQRGPRPSEPMLAAIARGLRLNLDERDHLFHLAGHGAPSRALRSDHVHPALLRVLDRLDDTPAQVVSELGETLVQNRLAVALLGNQTEYSGPSRYAAYRWFTDPAERRVYPEGDRERQGRIMVAMSRAVLARHRDDSRVADLVRLLRTQSPEFAELWERHEVVVRTSDHKTIVHPELGDIELDCQILVNENRFQALLIFTAVPGSEGYQKLELLSVIGSQRLDSSPSS